MVDSNNLNVIKYIIRQTPIGHLNESIDNLKNIIGEEVIDTPEIQSEIISYEEDHLQQFPISTSSINNNNTKILISKQTKDSNGYYYDQSHRIKIKVTPLSTEISSTEPMEFSSSLQKALDANLKAYKDKYYKESITTTNVSEKSMNQYVILISSHNINKQSYWSGEWISSWELNKKSASYVLKGIVKANTFYYEEGNIQFHLETTFDDTIGIGGGDDGSIAKEVIKIIEDNENKVQTELDQVYDNFSDNYIKPLRRKLPVTGTKMNWNLNQIQFNK